MGKRAADFDVSKVKIVGSFASCAIFLFYFFTAVSPPYNHRAQPPTATVGLSQKHTRCVYVCV